ncbi:MAG: pyridoxamine 5'-phosphate oxidase family protein [Pseudomonadales bacterium]|nr:pyridoxamine 5'-phosphate oxidase family protein [Pseudomonadales bacterium]
MAGPTPRATVKRNARRAEYDTATLKAILASDQVCHVAYVEDGEPRQIPTLYFCDDEYLYLHGNRQSALLRYVGKGGEICVTVTLVDGVVVARSGFHCSMNYRSVTLFGRGEALEGKDHLDILNEFVRALVPGHEQAVREPTSQELAATAVVRIPLTELSGKVRTGPPADDEGDLTSSVWAGEIPVARTRQAAVASEDLRDGIEMPDYIKNFEYRG